MERDMTRIALFAALIAALGLIPSLTLGFGVPITAQSMGVMLAGAILGAKRGALAVLLFLASNGAKSVISLIVEVGPAVFFFAAGTVLIHGLIIFGVGLALRIDPDVLSIASQSTVGGPTTAMALVGSRRRSDLILPGVISGLLGYALGNYAGIAIAHIVRGLFGV